MEKFKAFLIQGSGKETKAQFVDFSLEELDPGEVVVEVAYSDINYKDALAATGKGKILRRPQCIGGIDFSGTVISSTDKRFVEGDEVLAVGNLLGTAHHGGYARFARVPADWLHKLPKGMSSWDAMAYGTAGFTAGIAIMRMEQNGLKPEKGPVLVTGSTGGVGSIAIAALAKRGYKVTALTGKSDQAAYLQRLGASEILLRHELDLSEIKPLETARWAGAVDNLGGDVLSWIVSSADIDGTIASIGLAAGAESKFSVMPFILRSVCLIGISSGKYDWSTREEVWRNLAGPLRPDNLGKIAKTIPFAEMPSVFSQLIDSKIIGRYVVNVKA